MSKRKRPYDAKELYLQGLMAFGNFFTGRMGLVKTYTADETRITKLHPDRVRPRRAA